VTVFALNRQSDRHPDGAFCVTLPPDGKLEVEIVAQGLLAKKLSLQEPAGSDRAIGDIVLSRGRSASVLVVDHATAAPVQGALVETDSFHPAARSVSAKAQTGADGRARLGGLPDAEVPIRISHDEYVSNRLVVRAGGEVRVDLLRGGSIDGSVRDGKGAPKAGVQVLITAADAPGSITGADGNFHLHGLPAGKFRLVMFDLRSGERVPAEDQAVEVAAGQHLHVDLVAR
jgi:hypothetical protein